VYDGLAMERRATPDYAGRESNIDPDLPGDAVPIYETNPHPPATGGELFWSVARCSVLKLQRIDPPPTSRKRVGRYGVERAWGPVLRGQKTTAPPAEADSVPPTCHSRAIKRGFVPLIADNDGQSWGLVESRNPLSRKGFQWSG